MSDIEQRYRRALRWYPKKWRATNEDAVVGTLLDAAENEQRSVPARGELANLRASAVTTRAGLVGHSVPPAVKVRAGTLALGLGTAISTAGVVYGGLAYRFESHGRIVEYFSLATFVLNAASSMIYVLWIGAFVVSLIGLRRTSAVLLSLTLLASIVWPLLDTTLIRGATHPGVLTSGYLDMLAVIGLIGVFASSGPRRRPLAVSGFSFVAALVAAYELNKFGYWGNGAVNIDTFWSPLSVWLIWLGIPLGVITAVVLWRTRASTWSAAILLATAPTLPLGLLAFLTSRSIIFTGIGSVAVAVLFVALILGALRLFGLRIRITRA